MEDVLYVQWIAEGGGNEPETQQQIGQYYMGQYAYIGQ